MGRGGRGSFETLFAITERLHHSGIAWRSHNQNLFYRGSTRRNADQYLLPLISTDTTDLICGLTNSFAAWQEFDCQQCRSKPFATNARELTRMWKSKKIKIIEAGSWANKKDGKVAVLPFAKSAKGRAPALCVLGRSYYYSDVKECLFWLPGQPQVYPTKVYKYFKHTVTWFLCWARENSPPNFLRRFLMCAIKTQPGRLGHKFIRRIVVIERLSEKSPRPVIFRG